MSEKMLSTTNGPPSRFCDICKKPIDECECQATKRTISKDELSELDGALVWASQESQRVDDAEDDLQEAERKLKIATEALRRAEEALLYFGDEIRAIKKRLEALDT
jgi:hypothetical protein